VAGFYSATRDRVMPPLRGLLSLRRVQLGSEMVISTNRTDITGTYKTAVGDPDAQTELPLKGTLHYPLISFVVDFPKSDSVCAWVGRFEEVNKNDQSELILRTIWVLGSLYHGPREHLEATEFWNTFQINQDKFTKTS
jgi:hypothetical protein